MPMVTLPPDWTLWTASVLLGASLLVPGRGGAAQDTEALDLRLHFVDEGQQPIAGLALRVRAGTDVDGMDDGLPVTTDAEGRASVVIQRAPQRRFKKMPNHLGGSLFSLPQKATHLQVGLELDGFGLPFLWTLDIDRYADGTVVRADRFTAWPADVIGYFTTPLQWNGADGAQLPDGLRVTALPWRPAEASLQPVDGEPGHWAVSLRVVRTLPA